MSKTKIVGKAEATADQMAAYLLSVNPNPRISMPVKDFCRLFLETAAKEGVRGDALFAQSCKETGNFAFTGTVKPEQNNFAGLGTTDKNTPGAYFPDAATGILAQAQHAKAYSTKDALSCPCVDPRYGILVKSGKIGTAPNWEDLGGKWAVPGYDTKKYKSLQEADAAEDSYGYQIVRIFNRILEVQKEERLMKINVHAGHNPDGKPACGAIGFIKESTENRKVKDAVISQLRQLGHTVYDCTCDDGTSQSDVLEKIVRKCNAHDVDLDVSIHFNAGANDAAGNGKTTGVEVYSYDASGMARECAERVCSEISALGFKNRGAKINKSFYVLRKTVAPAMLIECCFVDDKDDVELYDYKLMADAIVRGIAGRNVDAANETPNKTDATATSDKTADGNDKKLYRVQVGAYSIKENADAMQRRLKEAGFESIIINA